MHTCLIGYLVFTFYFMIKTSHSFTYEVQIDFGGTFYVILHISIWHSQSLWWLTKLFGFTYVVRRVAWHRHISLNCFMILKILYFPTHVPQSRINSAHSTFFSAIKNCWQFILPQFLVILILQKRHQLYLSVLNYIFIKY